MYQEGLPSKRSDPEEGEVYPAAESALKILLVGSTLLALVPLSQILLTGGKWSDRAYTFQLALPALTIAANGYTLASQPDRGEEEEASWMPVVERAACFLGAALTTTALGHLAHSPTPVLGSLLIVSALWTAYRSHPSEEALTPSPNQRTRAHAQLIGVAAASGLAATALLMNRYLQGSLMREMRNKLITLGQGSLLAASIVVLLGKYYSQLEPSK